MKRTIFLFLLLTTCSLVFAQDNVTVNGMVSDGQNMPMPGATVLEKGTKNSTVTSIDGFYQIKVKANATLVFSFIGTKTTEEKLNGRTTINTKLTDEANSLNEVVVVGYGTQKRKDLTGAISSVKGEELAKIPVQNVAQALQGRIAGMEVTMSDGTPGSDPSIKIRGGMSITQSNEPLYVIDGVPQTDGIGFLDPMDIESIDILKDASSTSIYGAQGGNGVILVTTKQTKSGKVTVNYDTYAGIKQVTSEIGVMNPYQFTQLTYERVASDPIKLAAFTNNYGAFDQLESLYANRAGKNWQKEIFGSPVMSQYHKLSISGGQNETKFNIFYSLNDDEGIMIGSASRKNIAKMSINHNVSKKFSISGIVNYSNQKITGLDTGEGGNPRLSMLQNVFRYRTVNGLLGTDDELEDLLIDPLDSSLALQSPLVTLSSQKRESVKKGLNASVQLQYNLTPKLVYRGLASLTNNNTTNKYFNDSEGILAIRSGGAFGGISELHSNRFNYNNTLTYSNTFAKNHKFDITAGQEYIYNYSEAFSVSASAFPEVNSGWHKLEMGTVPGIPTSLTQDDKIMSFFARSNYSYKNRYLLSASLRTDGSSKFGPNNRWGYFPAVSAAWRVINEDFMKNATAISDLKLRASYGQAGNNRIANYAALGIFDSGSYPLDNSTVTTAFQRNLPNPNLKWESTQSTNLGLDLGFFNQRITLTSELYENRSKDLLYNTRIPANSGFTNQFQNIGSTSSRGLEFTLNTANIKKTDFSWNTSFNIAFNKTKVLSLSEGETSLLTSSYFPNVNDYLLEVGKPVGIMYGYVRDGLYQVSDFDYNATNGTYALKTGVVSDIDAVEQPGFIKFKDINGDGVINSLDRTAIGNANPKFTGGINNTFSYKGIDLSIFLNFTVGNDIFNANVLNNANLNTENLNSLAVFADRWTTINAAGQRVTDPTELAALNAGKTNPSYIGNGTGRLYSDIIEDGSFLRINNISLGYTLPKKWLNAMKISNMRFYVTAYNLYVFTKYSGYDPEVSVINNALTPGVDFSAYPKAKSFITGLNISL
ncbi:MAG: SusC/RagA family protein [Flavobacteriales bacterium 32-34-25]|nr:MAG: SusC/RagA family protein [Flavobacteriales bacterium 32-34-25]